ncbi:MULTISPECIES: YegS/Rv2252/BmrU family lipid kinase [unclassified Enterococcus]|uniref:diacylglycerol/lipid kinase family protein n=1 Tax=unclassified Enterococcus TaxID=2608891 RepID=UPI001551F422|nr:MULTISPECIES: YegS/Rv2252/BmrU family lipid kinase [unclassified Enterococcus]MBS7577867.1 YegS/Rv2252/BmrU family lipid kinase [Enterococcus sp. MMGLQ5-2]MBS7585127.1 YegS/Rv2252/BmrU family lipid kinase [Enterococcus sp. MMGLQ5-1]NPD12983.1 YegS/Rv2252/BmrU family lipid kinase [Enterococcus sp. MMGLQ5-1]NPD37697.1 YegS/Rv2252/BmrU family lipid kinase [Enterococcus sp. MMGLQ5-2]
MNYYHIIVNQEAGNSKNKTKIQQIFKQLTAEKQAFKVYQTQYAGEEKKIAEKIIKHMAKIDRILVIGGDGTLSNVLQAVGETPVGYIATGTGNDFARGICLPLEPIAALKQFQESKGQKLNVINYRINNKSYLALNNVGVGLDAAIVAKTNQSKSKKILNRLHLGNLSYIVILFRLLFQQKPFPVEITTADYFLKVNNAFLLTVTNHPYFGGGIPLWPDADIYSNQIDVVLIKRYNLFKLLYLLILIVTRRQMNHSDIIHLKTDSLNIKILNPEFLQADGEDAPQRPYEIHFSTQQHHFWL